METIQLHQHHGAAGLQRESDNTDERGPDLYLRVIDIDDVYEEIADIVTEEVPPVYRQAISDNNEHTAVYCDSDVHHSNHHLGEQQQQHYRLHFSLPIRLAILTRQLAIRIAILARQLALVAR